MFRNSYTTAQNWGTLFGRLLLSAIFILAGTSKVIDFNGTVTYMQHAGLTSYTEFLATGAAVFELGGGVLVLLGFFARFGAFLLFIFTLSVSFSIHHFWNYPAAEVMNQMINFQKNMAIAGGMLYVMIYGAGGFSFDAVRLARRHKW